MYNSKSSPKIKFCLEEGGGAGFKKGIQHGWIQTVNLIEYIRMNFYMGEGGEGITTQTIFYITIFMFLQSFEN